MTIAIYIAGLIPSPASFPTKQLMRILGPPLIILFYCLVLFMTITYFWIILPWYIENLLFASSITMIGLVILFNLSYNYTVCLITNPGIPSSTHEPQCTKCKKNKPQRAHHCSICQKCILKMDHHCPWINNCLGLRNHRYFLLFLLYLELGCVFYSGVSIPVYFSIEKNPYLLIGITLCVVFSIVILLFGGWHWYLAISGYTTIEFFDVKGVCYSRGNWKKNLEVVFGTKNFLRILMPSRNELKFDGVYWPDTIHSV